MKFPRPKSISSWLVAALLGILITFANTLNTHCHSQARAAQAPDDDLAGFAALSPIDAHVHLFKDDPAFGALLRGLNMRALNICVIDDRDPFYKGLEPQRGIAFKVVRATGGRAVVCTTFSPYDFETPGFAARVTRQLDADFAAGAIAVKIYKVMGMEMKSKEGKYVMPDDPAFDPIYQHIAARNRTVVAHIAAIDACWLPPNPASPGYQYFQERPQEYAYLHPEWPAKATILAARDHFVAENPTLRVVGAHLGCMEMDVNQMAQRFDRYPNFAVDTAARVAYLRLQPRDKVRAFLIKYQDRILYGTDLGVLPNDDTGKALQGWKNTYARDWKYFSTAQTIEFKGHSYQGLTLPQPVLRKIFHDNAVKWLPGIERGN